MALALVASTVGPASAVEVGKECKSASGAVVDPYGFPIRGALVSVPAASACDNTPTAVLTDEHGEYTIYFSGIIALPSSKPATVSNAGYGSQTKSITGTTAIVSGGEPTGQTAHRWQEWAGSEPLDAQVLGPNDFLLKYEPTVSYTRYTQSGETISLAMRSLAPPATSQAEPGVLAVTDLPGGSNLTLTPSPPDANGFRDWTGSFLVDEETPDGDQEIAFCLVDQDWSGRCDEAASESASDLVGGQTDAEGGVSPIVRTFSVDNRPPSAPPLLMTPRDNTTTIFGDSGQPLQAHITDTGGVGVDPSSIAFTLRNLTTGSEQSFQGPGVVTYLGGVATTAPLVLSPETRYHLTVSAADYAGNVATSSHGPGVNGGFLTSSLTTSDTSAQIPPTACELSDINLQTGFKTATCTNVPLAFDATTFEVGPWMNAGRGFADFTVSLEGAELTDGVAVWPAYQFRVGDWSPRAGTLTFEAEKSTGASTVDVAARTITIGQLQAQVPPTWASASLRMASSPAAVDLPEVCADPRVRPLGDPCRTDPTATGAAVHVDWASSAASLAAAVQAEGLIYDVFIDETSSVFSGNVSPASARVLSSIPGVLQVRAMPEAGYTISKDQLLSFNITTSAAGQTALDDHLDDLHSSSSSSACPPGEWDLAYNVFDISAATGALPSPGHGPLELIADVDDLKGEVFQEILGETSRRLGISSTQHNLCGGGGGPNDPDPDHASYPENTWRVAQKTPCSIVKQSRPGDPRSVPAGQKPPDEPWFLYKTCPTIKELYNDGDDTLDAWSLGHYVNGEVFSKNACCEMNQLGFKHAPNKGPVQWIVVDDAPVKPNADRSISETCDASKVSVGFTIKAFTIAHEFVRSICEKEKVNWPSEGVYSVSWESGGVSVRNQERNVAGAQEVWIAEGVDMEWTPTTWITPGSPGWLWW